jgi:hypothetical protein
MDEILRKQGYHHGIRKPELSYLPSPLRIPSDRRLVWRRLNIALRRWRFRMHSSTFLGVELANLDPSGHIRDHPVDMRTKRGLGKIDEGAHGVGR